jgi:hypothetical protein
MSLTLFGSNCPAGAYFLKLTKDSPPETWGRTAPNNNINSHIYCNLADKYTEDLNPINGILVSFAPIWLLVPFLTSAAKYKPQILRNLTGVIACSSSSFMTKRFAYNNYDRQLSKRLMDSHEVLEAMCKRLDIPCQVLAPTLIYGAIGIYKDRNLTRVLDVMRHLPVICLPKNTGLRQPIHASQLAMIAKHQADKMLANKWGANEPIVLTVGGDETLDYRSMLIRIRDSLGTGYPGKKCKIITISERIYFILIAFLTH